MPVGIKMSVGKLSELELLVEAMRTTGEGPDYFLLGRGPKLAVGLKQSLRCHTADVERNAF